jgi:pyruvate carboxylase
LEQFHKLVRRRGLAEIKALEFVARLLAQKVRLREGFPKALQKKILKGEKPLQGRPGALLPAVDFAAARPEFEKEAGRAITDQALSSYLMYPKVFMDYVEHRRQFSDVSVVPKQVFFYELRDGQ